LTEDARTKRSAFSYIDRCMEQETPQNLYAGIRDQDAKFAGMCLKRLLHLRFASVCDLMHELICILPKTNPVAGLQNKEEKEEDGDDDQRMFSFVFRRQLQAFLTTAYFRESNPGNHKSLLRILSNVWFLEIFYRVWLRLFKYKDKIALSVEARRELFGLLYDQHKKVADGELMIFSLIDPYDYFKPEAANATFFYYYVDELVNNEHFPQQLIPPYINQLGQRKNFDANENPAAYVLAFYKEKFKATQELSNIGVSSQYVPGPYREFVVGSSRRVETVYCVTEGERIIKQKVRRSTGASKQGDQTLFRLAENNVVSRRKAPCLFSKPVAYDSDQDHWYDSDQDHWSDHATPRLGR
jgi:hypothetical protein